MLRSCASLCACLLLLEVVTAYPEISGSCYGMITDSHHPNNAKTLDGGFKIVLSPITSNGTYKSATLSINSTGYGNFKGFLFKSYDLLNGGGLGEFSSLPPYTAVLDSCPGKAAVTHYSEEAYFNKDKPLRFTIQWPSNKELGFQAFLVESTNTWYELRSSTNGDYLPDDITKPPREGPFTVRLNQSKWVVGPLVFYGPILLIVIGAILSHLTNGPGKFGGFMHRKLFSKELGLPEWYHSESLTSPGFWVRLATMDVAQSFIEMTWGEMLTYLLLMASQIASLIVWIVMLSDEQSKYFHYKDHVHPYDAVVARAFGRLLQYNLALTLFLPTRHSLWPSLIGISFERLIKYHRIVSRVTFVVMIIHLILMSAQYGFLQMFTVTDTLWGFGNLFGMLAGIGMLLIVLFALEPVRRSAYDLFMAVHLLAFPVLVLAVLHATDTVVHLIPPLALFVFDFLLRMYQWMINVKVQEVKVYDEDVVNLKIVCPAVAERLWNKGARAIGSFVSIACSDISANPSALHPFSVSGFLRERSKEQEMSQMADGTLEGMDLGSKPVGIQVHIKSMGPKTWTQRLLEAAKNKGSDIRVRLEGPYGHMSLKLAEFQHVLMIAGGIGITPMMPVLEMALSPERRKSELPALRSLRLIWIVQSSAHLLWFQELLEHAFMQTQMMSTDFQLKLHLYVTQKSQVLVKIPFTLGRPQLSELIRIAAQESMGDKAALLCGPTGLTREASARASENGFSVHVETFRL
uniref:FAD-binding FR-type domain-containing protein n=1 Tax=Guillardia theta TaxID=55529 RepID=A0A7S4NWH9_GUITH